MINCIPFLFQVCAETRVISAFLQLRWHICIFCKNLFQPLDFWVEIWYHKLIIIVKIERGRKMFEKVKTLHFESEAFQAPSNYDIFPDSKRHTCLIYGRNGAGKSTLAKAFRNLKGDDADGITSSSLADQAGTPLTLSEEERKSIYVFDEDYINQKIKIKGDKLESIIMLGEQADIDDKIHELESEQKQAEETLSQAESEYSRFTAEKSTDNPDFYFNRARTLLKQNWAVRRKAIMQLSTNASVGDDKVHAIAKIPPSKPTIEETQNEYYEKQKLLISLRSNECHPITDSIPNLPPVDEKNINALLLKKVERPELTDRENRMVQLISDGKSDNLKNIRAVFTDPEVSECPFCYQPVTQNYKEHLIESIKAAFNRDVEEHIQELDNAHINPLDIDFSAYYAADKALCDECRSQLNILNDIISKCNINLEQKKEAPFSPFGLSDIGLDDAYHLLSASIQSLKIKIQKYNQSISNITNIQSQLNKLNDEIAFYEINQDYTLYLQKKNSMKTADNKVKSAENEIGRIRHEIETLEQKKEQITIAVDIINSHLRYIFFDKDRLEIKCQDNKYVIKSRGRSVRPDAISVGERNIIALCYFFADMFNGKEEKKQYANETMVVIDDPVSSFDIDNRIGIISFLNRQFRMLLTGNENTRIVLMSHDLQTIDDIGKAFNAINKPKNWKSSTLLLKNNKLEPKNNILNEYQALINIVYDYANGIPNGNELTIGNTTRRVAEAFTTFEYKGGIDELLNSEVLGTIHDDTLRDYFEGRLTNILLHGSSHMEDRIKTLTNPGFTAQFSKQDKQNTARDIICLLYLLNKPHMSAYLDKKSDFETTIEQWCEDIRTEMGKGTKEDK